MLTDTQLADSIEGMLNFAYKQEHDAENDPFRAHLGGSMIGRSCDREIWYGFRWAKKPDFDGRMLRLFGRGHKEEFIFVADLRRAGFEVQEYAKRLLWDSQEGQYIQVEWDDIDWMQWDFLKDVSEIPQHLQLAEKLGLKLAQWRIGNHSGHFGGSLDGKAVPPFEIPGVKTKILLEFKTHNTKSFAKLKVEGVKKAKPEHWAQMQTYMHHEKLDAALYGAVDKDTDKRHFEIVRYDKEAGEKYTERARRLIYTTRAPDRVGKHPSWFECKFCSYQGPCHYNEAPDRNCRSCKHSMPVDGGAWHCIKHSGIIPVDFIPKACDGYEPIHD